MNAGLLKEDILILSPYVITNDFGEETTAWEHKYKTKARVLHNGGNRTTDKEIYLNEYREFQVRYYVPIDEYDRIEWNGRTYRVLQIDPSKELLNITIKTERVND